MAMIAFVCFACLLMCSMKDSRLAEIDEVELADLEGEADNLGAVLWVKINPRMAGSLKVAAQSRICFIQGRAKMWLHFEGHLGPDGISRTTRWRVIVILRALLKSNELRLTVEPYCTLFAGDTPLFCSSGASSKASPHHE